MDNYVDLTYLLHNCITLTSIFFVSMVDAKKMKWYDILCLYILPSYLPILTSIPTIFRVIFFVISTLVPLVISHHKDGVWMALEFLFSYYFLVFFLEIIEPDIPFYHGFLLISVPKTILWIFALPIFLLITYLSSKIVDRFYHFNRYRQDIVIQVKEKKYRFRAYYDTGNTLLYKGIPVIFLTPIDEKIFSNSHGEILIAESLDGRHSYIVYLALLAKDGKKYLPVYVAISPISSFHGCDCLLNAYL